MFQTIPLPIKDLMTAFRSGPKIGLVFNRSSFPPKLFSLYPLIISLSLSQSSLPPCKHKSVSVVLSLAPCTHISWDSNFKSQQTERLELGQLEHPCLNFIYFQLKLKRSQIKFIAKCLPYLDKVQSGFILNTSTG